jgi:hypothetical protein
MRLVNKWIISAVIILGINQVARAEEAAPAPAPAQVQVQVQVPAPQTYQLTPAPVGVYPPGYVDGLQHRGQQLRLASKLLAVAGSLLVATGVTLAVLSVVEAPSSCNVNDCSQSVGLLYGGIASIVIGGAADLASIPTAIVGRYDLDKAQRLRLTGVAAAPLMGGSNVAGAAVSASFRF